MQPQQPQPYTLSRDSRGRQWWRLNCAVCFGQYGGVEAPYELTGRTYVCLQCDPTDTDEEN